MDDAIDAERCLSPPTTKLAAGEDFKPRLRLHHLALCAVQARQLHPLCDLRPHCNKFYMTRTCCYCGNDYKTPPSCKPKYCSSACAGLAKRKGVEIKCAQCGTPVWKYPSSNTRFCSKSCARTAANLTDKNPSFTRDISGKRNPMYGRGMVGEANPMFGKRRELSPRWRGGRKTRPDGYVRVIAPVGHPARIEHRATGLAYVLEHRLVVERHIGRYLTDDEVVHHIDGNPSNNSIENLAIMSKVEHGKLHQEQRRQS